MRKIKKVLIIERSEMGLRALETCQKMDLDFVVGFTESDSGSLLVRKARKYSAHHKNSGISYLGEDLPGGYHDIGKVIATAQLWNCDAVYPGYNVLAENHLAVEKIRRAELIWIGPNPNIIRIFSNRYATRSLAKKYGLPVFDAFPLKSTKQLLSLCQKNQLSFPFMLKTLASGGGRGNNIILDRKDLKEKLSKMGADTKNYYAEKYISGRHIELQFMAGRNGVKFLGTRDCSCQIKFQKILEEGPAEADEKLIAALEAKIAKMLVALDYVGIGTAEFIYDLKGNVFHFLEINPRIQVESPVTEKSYGIDLVAAQFALAGGDESVLRKNHQSGKRHVIEARIYARDPYNNFAQTTGQISILKMARIEGITYYSGYQKNDIVSSFYDPLIMKIVSCAPNRKKAVQKLKQSLETLRTDGLVTDKELLLWLLAQKEFLNRTLTQVFTEEAWQKHLDHINDDRRKFLETGIFQEFSVDKMIDPEKLINRLEYSRKGVRRNYLEELESKHHSSLGRSAFHFGIFRRDSFQSIFSFWDFSYFGGTLGADEALAVEKCFKLAQQKKISVVMIARSGGARQQENTLALAMMQYIITAYQKSGRPFFINIYDRENFGGLNASILEQSDVRIAVENANIGLTGPKFLAEIIGTENLPEGAQSAKEHYAARTIDYLSPDLLSACEKAFALCGLVYDNNVLAKSRRGGTSVTPTKSKELSVSACLKHLNGPKRLRFSDLLDPKMEIFENLELLSNFSPNDPTTYPPIMGALAQLGKYKIMLLGQQSLSGDGRNLSPGAKDFRWMRKKMKLAEKLKLPIILFGDTTGANASLNSEYDGVSHEISYALSEQLELSVPIISLNIGLCGSGGGLPFVNPADAAGALERSLKMVSDIRVQGLILSGESISGGKDEKNILDSLKDATAQGQLRYGLIDEIIPHSANKDVLMRNIIDFIIKELVKLVTLDKKTLLERRFDRQKTAINRTLPHTP